MNTPSFLKCISPKEDPQLRLVCFPYAGAGASVFHRWVDVLPETVELHAVQLPGRETRIREVPVRDMNQLIKRIHPEIVTLFDGPVFFFGHSMGALIAYEYSLYLGYAHNMEPNHLFLSGRRGPNIPSKREPIHDLPDDQFIDQIRKLGGTPEEVLTSPELLGLMLPLLRADFALIENHLLEGGRYLSCPTTAMGGESDPKVSASDLSDWREATVGRFREKMYSGGHFFLNEHYPEIVREIVGDFERNH